MLNDVLLSLA